MFYDQLKNLRKINPCKYFVHIESDTLFLNFSVNTPKSPLNDFIYLFNGNAVALLSQHVVKPKFCS